MIFTNTAAFCAPNDRSICRSIHFTSFIIIITIHSISSNRVNLHILTLEIISIFNSSLPSLPSVSYHHHNDHWLMKLEKNSNSFGLRDRVHLTSASSFSFFLCNINNKFLLNLSVKLFLEYSYNLLASAKKKGSSKSTKRIIRNPSSISGYSLSVSFSFFTPHFQFISIVPNHCNTVKYKILIWAFFS